MVSSLHESYHHYRGGNRLVRKKPYRSLAKATNHAMPNSTNAILSLPPQHARRVIDLGKDVSREQRVRHQVTLGEESQRQ